MNLEIFKKNTALSQSAETPLIWGNKNLPKTLKNCWYD